MRKERLMGAIVLGGSLGLIANPVWSHDLDRYGGVSCEDQASVPRADSGQESISSRQILEAQKQLDEKGFHPGNLDGVMDTQTAQAIIVFQQENNLPVSGTLDQETSEQLGIASNSQLPDEQVGPQARLSGEEQSFRDAEAFEPHVGMYR